MVASQRTTGAIRLVYAVFLLVRLYIGVLLGVAVTGSSTRRLFDAANESVDPTEIGNMAHVEAVFLHVYAGTPPYSVWRHP